MDRIRVGGIKRFIRHPRIRRRHFLQQTFTAPAMITLFPFAENASASPRPIPDAPPVINIVLPEVFTCISYRRRRAPTSFRG